MLHAIWDRMLCKEADGVDFDCRALADAGPRLHLGEWLAGSEASLLGRERHLVLHFMNPNHVRYAAKDDIHGGNCWWMQVRVETK